MTTTTTTLAFGANGLVAGLGLAAAGAVGLGLLGAVALANRGGDDDKKHYHKKPHHQQYHHQQYHHHQHHKRSAEDQANVMNNALNLIRQQDYTGCGLRLMCELAGEDEEELSGEELAILSLAGPLVKPGEGLLPPGGAGDYAVAKSLGLKGANCGQAFPSCPFNGTQLMETVMEFLP